MFISRRIRRGWRKSRFKGSSLLLGSGNESLTKQIITKDTTQSILYRIVRENITSPNDSGAKNSERFDRDRRRRHRKRTDRLYFEQYTNAQLAAETAAKAAKLGIRMRTDARTGARLSVYKGATLQRAIPQGMRLVSSHKNLIISLSRNTRTALKT